MPLGASKAGLMGAAAAVGGVRGIFFYGKNAADPSVSTNTIEYITIGTLSDGVDFGDSNDGIFQHNTATSNGALDRAVSGGGIRDTGTSLNIIEYVTVSTPSNATDFGNLYQASRQFCATCNSSNDRGVFGGGYIGSSTTDVLQYITVSSTGDASDFGNATTLMQDNAATSNGTNERGIWMGGNRYVLPDPGPPWGITNTIDYITINSASNATDFGDLTQAVTYPSACSNQTNERGIRSGGYVYPVSPNVTTVIDYVTINSPSTATSFGDLTASVYGAEAASNGTDERGLCMVAGYPGGVNHKKVEYVTINSTGDAQDFGDLFQARANFGGADNAG